MKLLKIFALAALPTLLLLNCQKELDPDYSGSPNSNQMASDRDAVTLPAGSVNQLSNALLSSHVVVLEPGLHTETNTVLISGYARIVGQPGAILRLTARPDTGAVPQPLQPGLHFKNAGGASIHNVQIEAAQPLSGLAILLENSPKATIQDCHISGFQHGVFVEKSPLASVFKNQIEISTAWQTGQLPAAHGIVVINGEAARIERNEVTGALFGIWACDKNGLCRKNYTHGNMIGIILCKVPQGGATLPDGTSTGAQFSGTNWVVRDNKSTGNYDNGIMVIDGANHNKVFDNEASNNGLAPLTGTAADIEIFNDSYLFGFLTPAAHDNTIDATKYPGTRIKNCGISTNITGGVLLNTTVDKCR